MKGEERYCASCRAELPHGAAWCEKCGADAGDVFDGRMPGRSAKPGAGVWWPVVLLVIAIAAGAWYYREQIPGLRTELPRTDTGPVRVVGQRPGGSRRAGEAKLSEAEAIITLRRHVTAENRTKNECIAVASRGWSGTEYSFDVVDSCRGMKLGRWKVDGATGEVKR
ncbi:MAG: hypothetical protein ACXW2X_09285 [Thermoanaerobaculia bacterium]